MRFVSIDVETANPNFSSICQIGVVRFEDGREVASESVYVDPEDYFDPFNEEIHGITADTVSGAPTFKDLHTWLDGWLRNELVVCHTSFDRTALAQVCKRYKLDAFDCNWLDSTLENSFAPIPSEVAYGLVESIVWWRFKQTATTRQSLYCRDCWRESQKSRRHFSTG